MPTILTSTTRSEEAGSASGTGILESSFLLCVPPSRVHSQSVPPLLQWLLVQPVLRCSRVRRRECRLDANLASSILLGTGSTQLLPTFTGASHVFTSSFTVATQTVTPPPFLTNYPQTPDIVGYTVTAQGTISSILSSDANSVIAAQYTHTLPNLNTPTQGQKTITAFPTVVTVNNCNPPPQGSVTLSTTTPVLVSHRPGETFVITFPPQTSSASVAVLAQDPSSMAAASTVVTVTTSTTNTLVARFTAGYTTAGVPLTTTKFSLGTSLGTAATLFVYEESNLPANWPFTSPGVVLSPQTAAVNLAIASQCLSPTLMTMVTQSSAVQFIGASAASSQWIGCGTATPFTSPCCGTTCP